MTCRCPAISQIADAVGRLSRRSDEAVDVREEKAITFIQETLQATGRSISREKAKGLLLDAAALGLVRVLNEVSIHLDATDVVLDILGGWVIAVNRPLEGEDAPTAREAAEVLAEPVKKSKRKRRQQAPEMELF